MSDNILHYLILTLILAFGFALLPDNRILQIGVFFLVIVGAYIDRIIYISRTDVDVPKHSTSMQRILTIFMALIILLGGCVLILRFLSRIFPDYIKFDY